MSEILDVPEVRERVMRWSVQQYERWAEGEGWPAHTELIRGVVIQNMPKSPLHCALAEWLYERIQLQLPAGYCALFERPLRLADSEPEPNLMVVKGAKPDFRSQHATTAELVIEIAVSTLALDRQNAALYAEAGVDEYWIVMGREQRVEIYRRPVTGFYTEVTSAGRGEVVQTESAPTVRIAVEELFA